MGHHHGHHHHAEGNLKVAFFLNLGFTIIEIVGGLYTNSLAILSDALHDMGDSLSLGLSWYFQKLSKKGRTKNFSYGYRRFSLLGALINSVVLLVGSGIILATAIPELLDPEETNATGMMYLAILGIIVNGMAVVKLKTGTSLNEKAVMLHLVEDVLGWIAVLAGSIIMMYFDAPFIDPLLSVLIALYILYNVVKNLRESLRVLLQGVPHGISISALKKTVSQIDEVADVHDCHIWSMDGNYNVLTVHLKLKNDLKLSELENIKFKVRNLIENQSIDHVTIEFDTPNEDCKFENC
ncbi:MAG: cation diffusion facilitator family transporter [Cyclobacteriaceae bacterium]